jgi:hypothetical protein
MGFVPSVAQVFGFMQDPVQRNGVLAYLDESGHPDTARISFSVSGRLDVIFGTSDESRKFNLIHADPRVGFNVTNDDLRFTVQLKGIVRELTKDELSVFEPAHYAKLGENSRRFRDLPDQHFFLIRPIWLRFSDCKEDPWTTTVLIGG